MMFDVILALVYFVAVLTAGFLGGIVPSVISYFKGEKK
jgi:ABC-type enterochelin transport system permease subunit